MWQIEKEFTVHLGGMTYIDTPTLVAYKGEALFGIRRSDDGMLGVDFNVYDKGGKRVAKFAKSVIVVGDGANYEFQSGHEAYKVTEISTGRIIARVQRRGVKGAELDVWVTTYLPNGFLFDAGPTATNLGGSLSMIGGVVRGAAVGIAIG